MAMWRSDACNCEIQYFPENGEKEEDGLLLVACKAHMTAAQTVKHCRDHSNAFGSDFNQEQSDEISKRKAIDKASPAFSKR